MYRFSATKSKNRIHQREGPGLAADDDSQHNVPLRVLTPRTSSVSISQSDSLYDSLSSRGMCTAHSAYHHPRKMFSIVTATESGGGGMSYQWGEQEERWTGWNIRRGRLASTVPDKWSTNVRIYCGLLHNFLSLSFSLSLPLFGTMLFLFCFLRVEDESWETITCMSRLPSSGTEVDEWYSGRGRREAKKSSTIAKKEFKKEKTEEGRGNPKNTIKI